MCLGVVAEVYAVRYLWSWEAQASCIADSSTVEGALFHKTTAVEHPSTRSHGAWMRD